VAGRDVRRDPDDWFDDPEPPAPRGAVSADLQAREESEGGAEDWLAGDGPPARRRRAGVIGGNFDPRLAVAAAVGVVALLAIVLALSGVFSSGTPRRAATSPTTTHGGTTTRSTTTAQTPATPLPAPAGPLKPGDQGTEVKVLQRALASLGYSTGAADGVYGPATKSAVEAFQKAAKLTADGILGPQTLAALKNALKGP
jgi:hypothetical protein